MKLFGILAGALLCVSLANAENSRTGLFLSAGAGLDGGKLSAYGDDGYKIRGIQDAVLNGRIGYAPIPNLAVYGIGSLSAYITTEEDDGHSLLYLGGGATCWLPGDFLVSASVGANRFFAEESSLEDGFGLGFRVSVGKDWRIFSWGALGVEAFYGHAEVDGGDAWNGNFVGLLFNVSYL